MSVFRKKILASLAIVILAVAAVWGVRAASPKMSTGLDERAMRRAKGNPSAPLWVVEYLDFQCPSCRAASLELRRLIQANPSKIFLQVKFYPLNNHPHGLKGALYAECAASQKKFWDFYWTVLEKQPEWTELASVDEVFTGYARSAGVDLDKLKGCVEDPKTREVVMAEKETAKSLGVNLTPTFFVSGTMFAGMKPGLEAIEAGLKQGPAKRDAS